MKPPSPTIAIVDDHSVMRECTSFRVSLLGYKVVLEADNGQHFLNQLVSSAKPDICLLDINMPLMDGFETLIHLKKGWPTMKVIILSMNHEPLYQKRSKLLGADGYILKDAPMNELKAALLRLTTQPALMA